MVVVLVLAFVVGLVIHSLQKERGDYMIELPSSRPNETWVFNVRDMNAELFCIEPRARLAYFELRRMEPGRWEMALNPEQPVAIHERILFTTMGLGGSRGEASPNPSMSSDPRTWSPCGEPADGALERAYRRYNDD